jgi:hypothetical protein
MIEPNEPPVVGLIRELTEEHEDGNIWSPHVELPHTNDEEVGAMAM